jgi:thioredoxin-related protein
MTRGIFFVIATTVAVSVCAQVAQVVKGTTKSSVVQAKKQEKTVKWVSFAEAQELQKITKKKIFVDVYTDWCGWCKRMDASTFSQSDIVDYLNDNYYAVKFNAEQKENIEWNGKTYRNSGSQSRSTHEFAVFLLNNRLSYPTTVFLAEDLNVIQPLPGYMDAAKFEPILHYFGTDSHKKVSWGQFEQDWKKGK